MPNYRIVNGKLYSMDDELCHHGIKGQRWGVRRYQNPDGTLTSEGKEHYDSPSDDKSRRSKPSVKEFLSTAVKSIDKEKEFLSTAVKNIDKEKTIKIGAVAAGTAMLAIGAYRLRRLSTLSNIDALLQALYD